MREIYQLQNLLQMKENTGYLEYQQNNILIPNVLFLYRALLKFSGTNHSILQWIIRVCT